MGRAQRVTEPGLVYHVLNRQIIRLPLFQTDAGFLAFERVIGESLPLPDRAAPGAGYHPPRTRTPRKDRKNSSLPEWHCRCF